MMPYDPSMYGADDIMLDQFGRPWWRPSFPWWWRPTIPWWWWRFPWGRPGFPGSPGMPGTPGFPGGPPGSPGMPGGFSSNPK